MTLRLSPVLALAACTDVNFQAQENTPPEVTIVTHVDGDTVLGDYPFELAAIVLDNGGAEDVVVTWFVDEAQACAGSPDPAGRVTCTVTAPPDGALAVRAEAQDDFGAVGVARVDLVVVPSEPPVAEILQPVAGRAYYDNTPISLVGTVSDAEDVATDLAAEWSSEAGSLGTAAPDTTGAVSGSASLAQGDHTVTLTVTDGSGKTGTASVDITVVGPNFPPDCAITAPADGTGTGQWNEIVFAAIATDPNVAPDTLRVDWRSSLDGDFATATPTVNGDVQVAYDALSLGDHTITLTVTDDAGATCSDSISVSVVEPPSAPIVEVSPDLPQIANSLFCAIDVPSVDPQGDPLSYRFEWSYDGVAYTGPFLQTVWPDDTVPGDVGAPGQTWECSATAYDAASESSPGTDTAVIQTPTVAHTQVGKDHSCQLDTNSWLECWGDTQYGVQDLDGGTYVEIGGGLNHTCGIDAYGLVRCAGLDLQGAVTGVPIGGSWKGLDVGDENACAIDLAGDIFCWGNNDDGQNDTGGLIGTWLQVSTGWRHTCAVDDQSNIECWGNNVYNRCDPPLNVFFSQVSAGKYHTCGLDTTGLAHCWGRNNAGEGLAPGGTFAYVGAGDGYSCGLRGTGAIECWGQDTGAGGVHAAPVGTFVQLGVGIDHSCAVDAAGAVTCWGLEANGELAAPLIWW